VKSKFVTLILFVYAASALVRLAGAAPSSTRPLHPDQILKLVQNYVASARLAEIVKQRGIDFDPTEEYLATLRKAGAEPVLLDALRGATRTKSRVPDDGIGPTAVIQQGAQTASRPRRQAESGVLSRPHDTSQTGADTFRSHLEAGRVLLAQNRLDEAVAEFRQASNLQADSAETHRALTEALFDQGDLDGATAEYRQAIRLGPEDAGAHVNLGLALYVKDDLDGAIAEYREAVRLNPKDPNSHFLLGNALAKKPDLEGCIAQLRDAVRLQPDFAEAHDDLGSALERKKDLRSALEQYQIAHSLEPHNLDYRFHYEHLSHALGH
jgi:tetratricopeptide (TPR) repeat protein